MTVTLPYQGHNWIDVPDPNNPPPGGIPADAARLNQIEAAIKNSFFSSLPSIRVASAYATNEEKGAAHIVCDGTNDEVEINGAISELKGRAPSQGVAGGTVGLIGPRFNVGNSIIIPSYVGMIGQGWYYTQIRSQNSWSGAALSGIVELDNTGPTEYTRVQHLAINGNKAGQSTVATRGLKYDVSASSGFSYNDAVHIVNYVRIIDTLDTAYYLNGPNMRAVFSSMIRIERPDGYGVRTAGQDSSFNQLDIGSSGLGGFYIAGGTNNRVLNSKVYFCGRLAALDNDNGSGYVFAGPRNYGAGLEAQDCHLHGFLIGSINNVIDGGIADSNSWATGNANYNMFDGFHIGPDVRQAIVRGIAFDKNEASRGYAQRYGFYTSISDPLSNGIVIEGVSDGNVSGIYGGQLAPKRSRIFVTGNRFVARGPGTTSIGSNIITGVSVTSGGTFEQGDILSGSSGLGVPSDSTIMNYDSVAGTITIDKVATAAVTGNVTAKRYYEFVHPRKQIINVKDFGAIGDGVANDTAEIKLAIDTSKPGDTIFFPNGTYSANIVTLKPNRTYIGEYSRNNTGSTKIILRSATNPINNIGLLTSEAFANNATVPDDGVVIKCLYLDGFSSQNTSGHAVVLMNRRSKIEDVRIANVSGDGILLNSANSAGTNIASSDVKDTVIDDCYIDSVTGNGIKSNDPANLGWRGVIRGTTINNTGLRGIDIDRAREWKIQSNPRLSSIGMDAIRASFAYRTSIHDNDIESYGISATTGAYAGIYAQSVLGRPAHLTNNRVNNGGTAVVGSTYTNIKQDSSTAGAVHIIISNNSIYGNGADVGISTAFGSATSLNANLVGNNIDNVATPVALSTNAAAVHAQAANSWNVNTAAPTTGTWIKGTRVENIAPAVGSPIGWICTANGTPGTWVALANL